MPKFQTVLWDVDNTLIDSNNLIRAGESAAVSAMLEHGLPDINFDDALDRLRTLAGYFNGTWYYSLLLMLGIECGIGDADTREGLAAVGASAFEQEMNHIAPFPGVEETLASLKSRGIRQGVISNALAQTQLSRLSAAGIMGYFEPDLVLISSDAIPRAILCSPGLSNFAALSAYVEGSSLYRVEKPWPVMFAEAVRRAGSLPDRTLFVGDLITDVIGANAAGLVSVLFCRDQSSAPIGQRLSLERPDYTISQATEVLRIVGTK